MIHDSSNEPPIIIKDDIDPENENEINACIFCISDVPPTTTYKGACNCHPTIHTECINVWHTENPNKCPICLTGPLQKYDIIIRSPEDSYSKRFMYTAAVLCCTSICCSPFIMIGLIFSIMSNRVIIYHNITNSTYP